MGIERRLLIIGNAVLFSAFGCDDTPEDPPGPDAQMRDAAVDGGSVDVGPEPDQRVADEGPLPDRDVDEGAPLDAGDLAVADAAADLAVADAALDVAPEPDLAVDMAPEPDQAVDMAPAPDLALPPDQGVVGCAALMGDRCEVNNEGCCVGGAPEAVCWPDATGGLSWQPIPGDFFCNCFPDENGRDMVACAVPGFVGIERAGRHHGPAPCLRALARLLG